MASRLSPLGIVVKWIVVPISLAAIGYFLVGPRVESKVPQGVKDKVREVANGQEAPAEEPNAEEDKPARQFTEPEVDVTVTALNTRENRPKKKRRKRRKPPAETTAPSGPIEPAGPPPGNGGEPPPPDGL
ncbi:MAG: hypothetical protein H7Y17_15190 [Chlorobia bacterium]|nr:hypothetical protein [Fimbriimonadaceae bacterium]